MIPAAAAARLGRRAPARRCARRRDLWAVGAVAALPARARPSCARRSSARRSSRGSTTQFPPRALIETLRARRSVPRRPRPAGDRRRRRDAGDRADPTSITAAKSVVRVTGTACGLGVEGTGWIARPDLIVTDAHVVAGDARHHASIAGERRGSAATSSRSTCTTTSPCCASRAATARRLPLADPEPGHAGRAPRLSGERPAHARRPAGSAARRRC